MHTNEFNEWKTLLYNASNYRKIRLPEEFIEFLSDEDIALNSHKIDWTSFSSDFKNLFPERFNSLKRYINWSTYSSKPDIREEQILEFQEYIHFKELGTNVLTNSIISNFGDKLNPETLSSFKDISDENIIRFEGHINWSTLLKNILLSNEMIDRYAKEIFSYETKYGKEYYETFKKRGFIDGISRADRVIIKFKNKTRIEKDKLKGIITPEFELISLKKEISEPFQEGMKVIEEMKKEFYKETPPKRKKRTEIVVNSKTNWGYLKRSNELSEKFIMEHHTELRSYINDVLETKKVFIARQTRVPVIEVSKKYNDDFRTSMVDISGIAWGTHIIGNTFIVMYPSYEHFVQGELIYTAPYIQQYILPKLLKKHGIVSNRTDKQVTYRIFRLKSFYKNIDLRVIKDGYYSLGSILKNNSLFKKSQRTKKFNNWLIKNNYLMARYKLKLSRSHR